MGFSLKRIWQAYAFEHPQFWQRIDAPASPNVLFTIADLYDSRPEPLGRGEGGGWYAPALFIGRAFLTPSVCKVLFKSADYRLRLRVNASTARAISQLERVLTNNDYFTYHLQLSYVANQYICAHGN